MSTMDLVDTNQEANEPTEGLFIALESADAAAADGMSREKLLQRYQQALEQAPTPEPVNHLDRLIRGYLQYSIAELYRVDPKLGAIPVLLRDQYDRADVNEYLSDRTYTEDPLELGLNYLLSRSAGLAMMRQEFTTHKYANDRPTLSHAIERLRCAHEQLCMLIGSKIPEISKDTPNYKAADAARSREISHEAQESDPQLIHAIKYGEQRLQDGARGNSKIPRAFRLHEPDYDYPMLHSATIIDYARS